MQENIEEVIAGQESVEVVSDPRSFIQRALEKNIEDDMDPALALERLLVQNNTLEKQNQQKTTENELLKRQLAEAQEFSAQFVEYKDILSNARTFLPVYLRNRVIFNQLLMRLRKRYGKLADIDSESKSGKQQAHLRLDHAVEIIIEYALLRWHEIEERLERNI